MDKVWWYTNSPISSTVPSEYYKRDTSIKDIKYFRVILKILGCSSQSQSKSYYQTVVLCNGAEKES